MVIVLLYHHCIWDLSLMWSCPSSRKVIHQQNTWSRIKYPQNFFWGLIHQGPRPRINPCHRHGYPGLCPGALGLSRGSNCLVLDQEPQLYTGGPNKGLLPWHWLIGPRPSTPGLHWGPYISSMVLAILRRMALATSYKFNRIVSIVLQNLLNEWL